MPYLFLKGVLEPYARVEYLPGKTIATADVRDADALIVRTRTRCDAALLEGSSVKLIATATIGFDHIDTEYCRRHGIEVATAAGCNARGVLQYVAAALVRLSRVQAWEPADKTLGIVGVGHVGSLVEASPGRGDSASWHAIPPAKSASTADPAARRGGVPGRHPHLPHSAGRYDPAHGRGEALRANEARQHPHQHFARRGSRWAGAPRKRFAIRPRRLGTRARSRPATAAGRIARHPSYRRLFRPGKANATALSVRTIGRYFGLSLGEWYPSNIAPSRPRAISWQELCDTIDDRFDIAAESRRLKENPEKFETIRNEYRYREEYF